MDFAATNIRNKWENQCIKKRNRKTKLPQRERKHRKLYGRSTNSIKKRYYYENNNRAKRLINMKHDKSICDELIDTDNIYLYNYDHANCDDNVLSIKSHIIPIWNCPLCTYRNIQRLSYCKICFCSFSNINKISINNTSSKQCNNDNGNLLWQYIECEYNKQYNYEYNDECDTSIQIAISLSLKSKKKANSTFEEYWKEMNKYKMDLRKICKIKQKQSLKALNKPHHPTKNKNQCQSLSLLKKLNISVSLKFFPKEIKQNNIKCIKLSEHELMQCSMNIFNDNDNSLFISSCSFIPSSINYDNEYQPLNDVLVPIYYDNKREPVTKWCYFHKSYQCHNINHNNHQLLCIAQYLWRARLPQYFDTKPIWQLNEIHHKNENMLIRYNISDIMIKYLPSKDILWYILFPYLGYHIIGIIKIDGSAKIPSSDNSIGLEENKLSFMDEYNAVPFTLFDTNINFQNASHNSSRSILVNYPFKTEDIKQIKHHNYKKYPRIRNFYWYCIRQKIHNSQKIGRKHHPMLNFMNLFSYSKY